jgi:hypothetical protein
MRSLSHESARVLWRRELAAPFPFSVKDLFIFFEKYGWRPSQAIASFEESQRIKRSLIRCPLPAGRWRSVAIGIPIRRAAGYGFLLGHSTLARDHALTLIPPPLPS